MEPKISLQYSQKARQWSRSWVRIIWSKISYFYFSQIHLILPSHQCLGLPSSLPFWFSNQNVVCISYFFNAYYVLCPPNFSLYHPVLWSVQIMKLDIMQSSPVSCHFILRPVTKKEYFMPLILRFDFFIFLQTWFVIQKVQCRSCLSSTASVWYIFWCAECLAKEQGKIIFWTWGVDLHVISLVTVGFCLKCVNIMANNIRKTEITPPALGAGWGANILTLENLKKCHTGHRIEVFCEHGNEHSGSISGGVFPV
jgi:hypothetical protein